jgi:ribosomal protein S18 acetylase RimI-like enzyme
MIRKASPEDARRISEIRITNWRKSYFNIISHQFLFDALNICEKAKDYYHQIEKEEGDFYVSVNDEIIDGYMAIRHFPCYEMLELCAIYVEPCFMRKGIGSALMFKCENRARELNCKRIDVWVFQENPIGRNFYKKHGFKQTEEIEFDDKLKLYDVRHEKELG